ncbi:hypothetical protein BJ085DRAFT_35901, partial [Dimargaris cristalligena]
LANLYDQSPNTSTSTPTTTTTTTTTNAIKLQTHLGLDQVYVINLDKRPDRMVQLAALAEMLHFKFQRSRANTSDEALDELGRPSSHRACWLSHMNVYRQILADPTVQTALVLEDDVDMDFDIQYHAYRALTAATRDDPQWDMVYLGHCSGVEGRDADRLVDSGAKLYRSINPICTHGYAVSRAGAQKLLQLMADFTAPLDMLLIELVKANRVKSYSVAPPLIIQYHFDGDRSDINADGNNNGGGDVLAVSAHDRLDVILGLLSDE